MVRPQKAVAGILPKGRCPEDGPPGTRRERQHVPKAVARRPGLPDAAGRGFLPAPGQCLAEAGIPLAGSGARAASVPSSGQGCVEPLARLSLFRSPEKIPYFGRKLYHAEAEYVASPIP